MTYREKMRREDAEWTKNFFKEHKITQVKIPVLEEDKNDPYIKPEYKIFMDTVEIGVISFGWNRLGGWGYEIRSEIDGASKILLSKTVKEAKRSLVSKAIKFFNN